MPLCWSMAQQEMALPTQLGGRCHSRRLMLVLHFKQVQMQCTDSSRHRLNASDAKYCDEGEYVQVCRRGRRL